MTEMTNSNIEAVNRVSRAHRDQRDVNAIEAMQTRGRWAPLPLADRPPRPPAPVRANSDPRLPGLAGPGRADINDTVQRIDRALQPDRPNRAPSPPRRPQR
eukprot:772662-Karenia_brevis.AAC.1